MANLLGSKLELQTTFQDFTFDESQIIGEDGYSRDIINTSRTGLTSTGYTNYKQNNLEYPQHSFKINVVMPRQESLDLISAIDTFNINFSKSNNNRNTNNFFILTDNRLAIIPEALPSSYPQRLVSSGWVFTDWPIIITNYQSELYGANYNIINLEAVQAF